MVTLDIKSENLKSFGAARAAKGDEVYVFAPGSAAIPTTSCAAIWPAPNRVAEP